jgi:hypothetical protein
MFELTPEMLISDAADRRKREDRVPRFLAAEGQDENGCTGMKGWHKIWARFSRGCGRFLIFF